MEFFATLNLAVTEQDLQQHLQLESMPRFCASIYEVIRDEGEDGEISTIWGVFTVHREMIHAGVRFTLPGCPNAAAWTVTADQEAGRITVHCTINRDRHDPDFVESLEAFVEDWRRGLQENLATGETLQKAGGE